MRPAYTDERGTWHPPGCECCGPPPFELWDDRLKVWIRCAYTALVLVIFCLWIEDDGSGAPAALRRLDSTIVVAVVTGVGGILVAILGDRRMQTEIALTERVSALERASRLQTRDVERLDGLMVEKVGQVRDSASGHLGNLDGRLTELEAVKLIAPARVEELERKLAETRTVLAVIDKDVRGRGTAEYPGLVVRVNVLDESLAVLEKLDADARLRGLETGVSHNRGRVENLEEVWRGPDGIRRAVDELGAWQEAFRPDLERLESDVAELKLSDSTRGNSRGGDAGCKPAAFAQAGSTPAPRTEADDEEVDLP